MQIAPGIKAIKKGIFLEKHKTLVIADLHLGLEEEYLRSGVLVPKFLLKDVLDDLNELLSITKPETLVINGDFKHNFGRILKSEWKEIFEFLKRIEGKVNEIKVIKGNHDLVLSSMKTRLEVVEELRFGDILVIHGDEEPKGLEGINTILIGHEHPAYILQEGGRTEKFKAYYLGEYKKKLLIVQPSFHSITTGSDIRTEGILSPILKETKKIKVFVVGDEILEFGKLKPIE